jgi:hypothetical protein
VVAAGAGGCCSVVRAGNGATTVAPARRLGQTRGTLVVPCEAATVHCNDDNPSCSASRALVGSLVAMSPYILIDHDEYHANLYATDSLVD